MAFMSDSILFRTINNYITGKVNETLEENQDIIIQLNSDISKLLNQRLGQIEKSSDKCRCDLEKLDVPLELPELPDFDFEMPEISTTPKINYENVRFYIDTDSLKGLIHREKSKFLNFIRALFGWNLGQQIYFYDEELSFDRYHHEFDKQYHSIEASLKDGEVFKVLCSENANMADELVKTIDRISDHLSDILELLKSSISKFSNLIDDTRKQIFPPLLVAPSAVFIQRTDRTHNMEMRIGNAAVLLVGEVNGKVHHHAPAHKLLQ